MRKKRIVLTALLVSAILCLLICFVATVNIWVPEEWKWLAKPAADISFAVASILIVLWMAIRRAPGDKILLDREEAASLRKVLTCVPWWFVFSVMAITGVAIWIGTWTSWWAAKQYPIQ
ncbi:MAG: hypothetical protein ACYC63_10290 [Armatimonadota bacterium]